MTLALHFPRTRRGPAVEVIDADTGEVLSTPQGVSFDSSRVVEIDITDLSRKRSNIRNLARVDFVVHAVNDRIALLA